MDTNDSDETPSGPPFRDRVIFPELSHSIVGAAIKVLNTLKPGLNEKAYENALVIELKRRGHRIEQQRRFDVHYEGIRVDTLVPDLLVDGSVIVDPKVVSEFNNTHGPDDRLSGHHRFQARHPSQLQIRRPAIQTGR